MDRRSGRDEMSVGGKLDYGRKRGGTGASFGEDTGTCPSARVGLAMNDSCECSVKRAQPASNQVFPVEIPTAILHAALAYSRGNRPASGVLKRRNSCKINTKEENLVLQLATQIRHPAGTRIHRQHEPPQCGRLDDRQFAVSTRCSRAI